MEDACHFLKYGTVLHGEWFIDGQRVPLAHGSHRQPLPAGSGLSERPKMQPDFPQLARMEARHDGCPNQFDYSANYHQTAEWRSKSAGWALDEAKARRAEAEAAIRAATAALEEAAEADQPAAAEALEQAKAVGIKVTAETVQVIESDGLVGAIIRAATKLVEYHGKAGYDALGNVPKNAVKAAIESKSLLNPGTREMVLYLAQSQQRPSVAKADKTGWEAVGRYIYAFYDTAKFTRFAVPDATSSFKGLQDHHRFIGLCSDRRLAERDGPLRVVKGFCACDPCLVLKNEECLLRDVFGNMVCCLLHGACYLMSLTATCCCLPAQVRVQVPLAKGTPLRTPQILSLEKFADYCDADVIVVMNVSDDELELEGSYWLALLSGPAFALEEDTIHCGQLYRKGWLVAMGRWYKLRQRSERGYELMPAEVRPCNLITMQP
jgi:hypothetical protein